MKRVAAVCSLLLVGCGSTAVTPPLASSGRPATAARFEAPLTSEAPAAAPSDTGRANSTDPPAADDAAPLPTLVKTPASELLPKTRADLDAAVARAKIAGSVDAASSNITKRLGKPTWVENGRKRVWVADGPSECHRLILDTDGTIAIEVAPVTETKTISARARQKLCTGDIEPADVRAQARAREPSQLDQSQATPPALRAKRSDRKDADPKDNGKK